MVVLLVDLPIESEFDSKILRELSLCKNNVLTYQVLVSFHNKMCVKYKTLMKCTSNKSDFLIL